jgi:uncharacterized surface protein with fasciclin (FAS1) repeats
VKLEAGGKVSFVGATTAMVVTADVLASNGVVHIIDTVLLVPADVSTTTPATSTPPASALSYVAANSDLEMLISLLTLGDEDITLTASAPITLLAPSDAAFAKLGSAKLSILQTTANRRQLRDLLRLHMFSGSIKISSLRSGQTLRALSGDVVSVVRSSSGQVFVGGAQVSGEPSVAADGSLVYEIASVMSAAPSGTGESGDDDKDNHNRTVAIVVPVVVATVVIIVLIAIFTRRRVRSTGASKLHSPVSFDNPMFTKDANGFSEA